MTKNTLGKKVSLIVVAAASLYGAYFVYKKYEEYKAVDLQRAIDAGEGKKIMSQDRTDDSHWKEVFPERSVTSHDLIGESSGGLIKKPLLKRSRTLPPREFEVKPPKFQRSVSAGVSSDAISPTPDELKAQEEIKIPDFNEPKIVEELEPKHEITVKDTADEISKLDEKEMDNEVDDLLFETDEEDFFKEQEVVQPDDYSKYEKQHDLIYSYNHLVELYPERPLGLIFGFLGIDDYWLLGREGIPNFPQDRFVDVPKIIVSGVSDQLFQPTLAFTIGAPGSGKTTWAKLAFGEDAVIAADDYFDLFNGGNFDRKKLSDAHEWCKSSIIERLLANKNAVCNNTNTSFKEMFDLTAAVFFGNLPHKVIFVIMPERNIKLLMKRNVHGVPKKSMQNFVKNIARTERKGFNVMNVMRAGPFPTRTQYKPSKTILYTGIFLTKDSLDFIRTYFTNYMQQPLLNKLMNGHVTLAFAPSDKTVNEFPKGEKIQLKVIGLASSPIVQCVKVALLQEYEHMCNNEHAHISLAVDKGCTPVLSNYLLKYGGWLDCEEENIILDGYFGTFSKNGGKIDTTRNEYNKNQKGFWYGDEDIEEELR